MIEENERQVWAGEIGGKGDEGDSEGVALPIRIRKAPDGKLIRKILFGTDREFSFFDIAVRSLSAAPAPIKIYCTHRPGEFSAMLPNSRNSVANHRSVR